MSSLAPSALHRERPPFPAGWSSIPLDMDELCLANTLPVGQSFLWHRHPLSGINDPHHTSPAASSSSRIKAEGSPHSAPSELDDLPTEEFSRAVHSPARVVLLRQSPSRIYYTAIHSSALDTVRDREEGWTRAWLDDYFQLARYPGLRGMYAEWTARDAGLFGRLGLGGGEVKREEEGVPAEAGPRGRARGIRVLRQDPWECLIAFITSTNNRIPRIASLMHRLGTHFCPPLLTLDPPSTPTSPNPQLGDTISIPDRFDSDPVPPITYHLFPRPHQLPVQLEGTLRDLGFGYRAGFIEATLASLRAEFGLAAGDVERGLEGWRGGEVEVVREKLVALKGVGRKVADCVMLMCLDQPQLIPIDTHLSAIAARHPAFPARLKHKPMSKALYDEVQLFLEDKWGPMGGWAQAVMFAADLTEATVRNATNVTPKKGAKAVRPLYASQADAAGVEGEELVKLEDNAEEGVAMDVSPESTVLQTPGSERAAWLQVHESPLRNRRPAGAIKRAKSETAVKVETPPRSVAAKGKRKANQPVQSATIPAPTFLDGPDQLVHDAGVKVDLPAAYGYKRTRSAARIELQRQSSGVSVLAEDVRDLDVA